MMFRRSASNEQIALAFARALKQTADNHQKGTKGAPYTPATMRDVTLFLSHLGENFERQLYVIQISS